MLALTLVATIGAALPASAEPGTRAAGLDKAQEEPIAQVNAERARYGADPVTFAEKLYPAARAFAQKCRLERADGHGAFTDNLYVAPGKVPFGQALRAWMQEAGKYNFDRPGFSPATSHFTQTVWKGSTTVAIAVATCKAGTIMQEDATVVVARFAPPGNVPGRFPQNVGRPQ